MRIVTEKYKELKISEISHQLEHKIDMFNEHIFLFEQNIIDFRTDAKHYYYLKSPSFGRQITIDNFNDFQIANGGGIWFEPYKIIPSKKYDCFYAYRKDGKVNIDNYYFDPNYDYLNQSWYVQIKNQSKKDRQVVWTKPYKDKNEDGALMITLGTGVFDSSSKFVGMVTIDLFFSTIDDYCDKINDSENGKIYLGSEEYGYVIADAGKKIQSTIKPYDQTFFVHLKNKPEKNRISVNKIKDKGTDYFSFSTILQNDMIISINLPKNEIIKKIDRTNRISILLFSLFSFITAAGVMYLFSRFVIIPVETLTQKAKIIGTGNLSEKIDIQSYDEIKILADTFNEMVDNLKKHIQKSSAKNIYLVNASYELRTSISRIFGVLKILTDSKLNQEQTDYVLEIQKSTISLLKILNDIMDISHAEAGKMGLENVGFDLCDLYKKTKSFAEICVKNKNIKIHSSYDIKIPSVIYGDPLRLKQILINLISNAAKFTQKGDIKINVKLLSKDDETAKIYFEVSDSGVGIPKEKQEKIFEAFSQADDSDAVNQDSTGLGLAISKQIVELMGGEIGLESEVGKGSKFFFTAQFNTDAKESGY